MDTLHPSTLSSNTGLDEAPSLLGKRKIVEDELGEENENELKARRSHKRATRTPDARQHHRPVESEPFLTDIPFQAYIGNVKLTPSEQGIFDRKRKLIATHWPANEIDTTNDGSDFKHLMSPPIKRCVINALSFFVGADGKVMENAHCNFAEEFPHYLIRQFYAHQAANEAIHAETYRKQVVGLLETDETLLESVLHCTKLQTVARKTEFVDKYMHRPNYDFTHVPKERHAAYIHNLQRRLIAFACVEGIMFSSSFAIIQWLKERNLCRGIVQANELISRDESLHCEFAIYLYNQMRNKLSSTEVEEIIREAVSIEIAFMKECFPDSLPGINYTLLEQHVCAIANALFALICPNRQRLYAVEDTPLIFMRNAVSMYKDNFFEIVPSGYQGLCETTTTTENTSATVDLYDF